MVTPLGGDVESTWAAAAAGRSGVREITRFATKGLPVRVGGEVDDARLPPVGPGGDDPTDRAYRLLAAAAAEAAAQARLKDVPDRGRVCVSVGGHGGSPRVADVERATRRLDAEGRLDVGALAADPAYDLKLFDRRRCDHAPGGRAFTPAGRPLDAPGLRGERAGDRRGPHPLREGRRRGPGRRLEAHPSTRASSPQPGASAGAPT